MGNTVKVKGPEGELELQVLSEEEIDNLLADNNPQSRKQIMDHMKALGRPVTELIKMKVPERKAFILERYAELGVGGKKAAGGKKGGTVTSIKSAGAVTGRVATGAANKAAKPAAAKAKQPEPEEDDEDDGTTSEGDDDLKELLESQGAAIAELKEALDAQNERFNEVLQALADHLKLTLDTHFIVRTALPTAAGLSEDDVVALGNDAGVYGRLLVSEAGEDDEAATGND